MAILLDIQGIPGESVHDTHPEWNLKIQISSTSYDVSQRASVQTGTGLVAAGASMSNISITKTMDKSTPLLFGKLTAAEPIDQMFLRFTRAGGAQGVYEVLTVQLDNVLVTSYHTSGQRGGGGMPTESLSFSVGSIKETYDIRDERGMAQSKQTGGYDFMQNVAASRTA